VNTAYLTRWGIISVSTIIATVALTGWTAAQESNLSRDALDPITALQLYWPVRGPINSGFGTRRSPEARGDVHAGVDIGARAGTPVRAPARGIVTFAGWQNGYGRTIILEHGLGVQSLYGHLSRFVVKRGQKVEQDATIGLTGNSGHSSGPHLHYEVRVNERPVNPRGPESTGVVAAPSAHVSQVVAAKAAMMTPGKLLTNEHLPERICRPPHTLLDLYHLTSYYHGAAPGHSQTHEEREAL